MMYDTVDTFQIACTVPVDEAKIFLDALTTRYPDYADKFAKFISNPRFKLKCTLRQNLPVGIKAINLYRHVKFSSTIISSLPYSQKLSAPDITLIDYSVVHHKMSTPCSCTMQMPYMISALMPLPLKIRTTAAVKRPLSSTTDCTTTTHILSDWQLCHTSACSSLKE